MRVAAARAVPIHPVVWWRNVMTVSVPTLILATGVVGFAVVAVLALLYERHRGASGYAAWSWGIVVHASSLVVLGFDAQLPERLAVAIGNPLAAIAPLLYVTAVSRLLARRAPLRTLAALTVAVVLGTWFFLYVQPSVSLRLTLLGLHFFVAQSVLIGMLVTGLRREPGRAYRTLLGLVVLVTLATVWRTLWFAFNADAPDADGVASTVLFLSNMAFFATAGLAYVGVLEDRNRRAFALANVELSRLSRTDALTDLANRRHFDETLAVEVARALRYGRQLTLVILDLDRFKTVNDTLGHGVGDTALRRVAQILRRTSRANDLPARVGGEELAMLLPETGSADGRRIAERVRSRVRAAALPSGRGDEPLTISAGVASLSAVDLDDVDGPVDAVGPTAIETELGQPNRRERAYAEHLLQRADEALYAAKRAGRDRTVLAGHDADEAGRDADEPAGPEPDTDVR